MPEPEVDRVEDLVAEWRAEAVPGGVDGGPWWESFGEPALDELVYEALQHNYDLQAAAARVATVAAENRIVRAERLPTVDFDGGVTRRRQNFIGFPIPGGDEEVLSTTFSNWDAGFVVGWEADLWGRLAARRRAAEATLSATRADFVGAQLSIAAQTAFAWFAVREARLQLELAEQTLESWRRSEGVVEDRYLAGLVDPLDLRLARSNTEGAEAGVVERRRVWRATKRRLELVLGRYPASEIEESGDLEGVPPQIPAGLPVEILSRRPDLAAARFDVEAALARSKEARANLWPRLSLTGQAGRGSEDLSDLTDGDFSVWSLAARLTAPIYRGGALRAGVDAADAVVYQTEANFVSSVLFACSEVEDALDAGRLLVAEVEHLETSAEEAIAATRLAQRRYQQGVVGVIEVLEAQRRQFIAESTLITARRALFDSRVELHLALGGGFDAMPPIPDVLAQREGESVSAAEGPGKSGDESTSEKGR